MRKCGEIFNRHVWVKSKPKPEEENLKCLEIRTCQKCGLIQWLQLTRMMNPGCAFAAVDPFYDPTYEWKTIREKVSREKNEPFC